MNKYPTTKLKKTRKENQDSNKILHSIDDKIVFIPAEDIQVIERVLAHWDAIKQIIYR
jgi:hypothetical protein